MMNLCIIQYWTPLHFKEASFPSISQSSARNLCLWALFVLGHIVRDILSGTFCPATIYSSRPIHCLCIDLVGVRHYLTCDTAATRAAEVFGGLDVLYSRFSSHVL